MSKLYQRKTGSYSLTYCLAAILFISLVYFSYRYIFQYNSEGTSPTYSNTPASLQILKYVILIIIFLLMLFFVLRRGIYITQPGVMLVLSILMIQSIYSFFHLKHTNSVITIITLIPAILMLSCSASVQESCIHKVIRFFMYYAILYEIVQIGLYFAVGRLPALGYATGNIMDVRFGGPLDDPNGFSVLLALLIPYAYYHYHGFKKIFFVGLLFVFLILTWSLTGIFSFLAVIAFRLLYCFVTYKAYSRKKILSIGLGIVAFIIVSLSMIYFNHAKILSFIDGKQGSISQHMESFDFSGLSVWNFLGIIPSGKVQESCIFNLMMQGGVFFLIMYYGIGITSVICLHRISGRIGKSHKHYSLYKSCEIFQVDCLIVSINLPTFYIFTVACVYSIILTMALANYKKYGFDNVGISCPKKIIAVK